MDRVARRASAAELLPLAFIFVLIVMAGSARPSVAHPVSWDVYYTRFAGSPNLKRAQIRFDGETLTVGPRATVASTKGADGVVFAPDGDLLIGAQGDGVHKVPLDGDGEHVTVSSAGHEAFHVALDPSGQRAWTSGMPGVLVEIPLQPFANGVARPLRGHDTTITSITFDATGTAYYTSADHRGGGSFGVLNLQTFTTRRILSDLPAAHAITFDHFSGDLFLFGSKQIVQIDPSNPRSIKSSLTFDDKSVLDQGTTDGEGHLLVARTSGHVVFVDYAASGLVGDPGNTVDAVFVESNLDDIAPLAGPGANPVAAAPANLILPAQPGEAEGEVDEVADSDGPAEDVTDSTIPWFLIVIGLLIPMAAAIGFAARLLRAAGDRTGQMQRHPAAPASPARPTASERSAARQRDAELLQAAQRGLSSLLDGAEPRGLMDALVDDAVRATGSTSGTIHTEILESSRRTDAVARTGGGDANRTPSAKPTIDVPLQRDGSVIGRLGLSRGARSEIGNVETALAPLAAVLTAALEKANASRAGGSQGADDAQLLGALATSLGQSIEALETSAEIDLESGISAASPDAFREELSNLKNLQSLLARTSPANFDDTEGPVDLAALAGDVAAALRKQDPARATKITIESGKTVVGNPKRLEAAVEGLIGAAWNATRGEKEASSIVFGTADRGAQLACFARCGLANPTREVSPAQSSRSNDNDQLDASQFGLSIARHALGGAHARVWTEKTRKGGTAFFFSVPGGTDETDQPHTNWHAPGPAGH